MLVAGTKVPPSDFPQHFTCIFQLRARLLLLGLAILSIAAFCLLVSIQVFPLPSLMRDDESPFLYLFALFTFVALWISTRWYSEQTLLARSIVTFGTVTGVDEMSSHRQVRYSFRDAEGGYFGGMERDLLSRQVDHIVFVLYDHSDPDRNSSSRGSLFRTFKAYPASQAAREESGNP